MLLLFLLFAGFACVSWWTAVAAHKLLGRALGGAVSFVGGGLWSTLRASIGY